MLRKLLLTVVLLFAGVASLSPVGLAQSNVRPIYDNGTDDRSRPVDTTHGLPVQIVSAAYTSTVSLTRTADTNAYAANDVTGAATDSTAALTFAGIGPTAGGSVLITTVRFEIDLSAVPSGMNAFRLYVYSTPPPSVLGDNVAWDLPSGDRASFRGYVDLGMPVDLGSTLYVETLQVNKQIVVPAGGALYGYLVTVGAYTPASATVFKIVLHSIGI